MGTYKQSKENVEIGKVLVDPYGKRMLFPKNYKRFQGNDEAENLSCAARSVVVDTTEYDWGIECAPKHDLTKTVIYEMHVKGFTAHESSGVDEDIRGTYRGLIEKIPHLVELGVTAVELLPIYEMHVKGFTAHESSGVDEDIRGTYRGLIEKIPHLVELGVTAVELLPVYQFDKYDALPGKFNYWGYCPMSFFAVHEAYSSDKSIMGPLDEFRDMVKALHRNGIEVILDVVYNHTSEGDANGPCYSFKGFDKRAHRGYLRCGV